MDTNTNNLPLNVEGFIRSLCDVMLRAAAPQPTPQPVLERIEALEKVEIDYSELAQNVCYEELAEAINTDGMVKMVVDNIDYCDISEKAAEVVSENIDMDSIVEAAAEQAAQNIDEEDIVRMAADNLSESINEGDVTEAAAELCAARINAAKVAEAISVEAVAKHVLAGLDYQKLAMAMVAALKPQA